MCTIRGFDAVFKECAILMAYAMGGYFYQQIADYFKIRFTSVGRIVREVSEAS